MKWVGGFLAFLLVASSYAANGENESENTPSCGTVNTDLAPCLSYIRSSNDPKPSAACCNGVKSLAGQAKSKGDRQAICNCVKQALGGIGSYDTSRIPEIPKKCGVSVSLPPIDKNYDCSKLP